MMKRCFDVFFALAGLLVLLPLMALIALGLLLFLGWPVFFRQPRIGRGGRKFLIVKFRTMSEERSTAGVLLPDAQREIALGRWLRRTSLDELPELWNVLVGDMSLVGPRPLLVEYLPLYNCEQARRHEIRPGVTGWAQVNGRNAISWEEKFRLDVWYVDHQSMSLDLRIVWLTVLAVLRARGISQPGHVTMEPFRGSRR